MCEVVLMAAQMGDGLIVAVPKCLRQRIDVVLKLDARRSTSTSVHRARPGFAARVCNSAACDRCRRRHRATAAHRRSVLPVALLVVALDQRRDFRQVHFLERPVGKENRPFAHDSLPAVAVAPRASFSINADVDNIATHAAPHCTWATIDRVPPNKLLSRS